MLERLVNLARSTAEEELVAELAARLSADTKARMLALLDVQPGPRLPAFQQLQRTASRPWPEAFSQEVEWLRQGQETLPAACDLGELPTALSERFADSLSGVPTRAIRRFPEPKRVGVVLCW